MSNRHDVGILPIQRAVASASPSYWRDLIVTRVAGGRVEAIAFNGLRVTVITTATPALGEPIAFHAIAEILAVGSTQFPVRITSA